MKIFRNPEVKKTLLLQLCMTAVAIIAAFLMGVSCGILTALLCAAFIAVYLCTTFQRYKRISALAADIDRILHENTQMSMDTYSEGELAILQSEIAKMTLRLREQQQRLQSDKLQLADALADISHQIRTPLTSINLLVSLISEPDISPERRQQLSRELQGLLSRIDWLITALLKLSKLDAGTVKLKTEALPLSQLLDRAVTPLLVPIELRGQTLHLTADGTFHGDILWTCEALTNIIKNCMEHTPQGGTLTVCAEENALYTQIVIADTGCGIAPEDLGHIFERFYKGRNSGSNSFGIGLALARMIITAQNGTVKAENRTEGGARFTVRFYKGTV